MPASSDPASPVNPHPISGGIEMNATPPPDSAAAPDPDDPSMRSSADKSTHANLGADSGPDVESGLPPHAGSRSGSGADFETDFETDFGADFETDFETGLSVTSDVAHRLVVLPQHLHARPAGQVAQAAARHRAATIELVAGERRANAVSVLSVMGLGAVTGTEVGVVVTGPQAEAIADELSDILRSPEPEAG